MLRFFINPLLTVFLLFLCFLTSWGVAPWVLLTALNLAVIAFFANGALAFARALTARPFAQLAMWAIVYLGIAAVLFSGAWDKNASKGGEQNHPFEREVWVLDSVAAADDQEELYLLLEDVAGGHEFAPPLDAQWAALAAHVAVEYAQSEALESLLNAGVSPNACFEGAPLLVSAIYAENLNMVHLLLDAGANPNYAQAGGDGSTPLMAAVMGGNRVVIDLLLDAGGDPYLHANNGSSSFDLAPNAAIHNYLKR